MGPGGGAGGRALGSAGSDGKQKTKTRRNQRTRNPQSLPPSVCINRQAHLQRARRERKSTTFVCEIDELCSPSVLIGVRGVASFKVHRPARRLRRTWGGGRGLDGLAGFGEHRRAKTQCFDFTTQARYRLFFLAENLVDVFHACP